MKLPLLVLVGLLAGSVFAQTSNAPIVGCDPTKQICTWNGTIYPIAKTPKRIGNPHPICRWDLDDGGSEYADCPVEVKP